MVLRLVIIFHCLVQLNGILGAVEPDPQVSTTQPGVGLTLIAEHPDLVTPTGIDVDDKGRVWVIATHTHMRPEDYQGPEHDEILMFDLTQKDSLKRHVFYNATTATMDLELGPDGWVYLAERDRILRIKDTNADGRADVEEEIVTLETEADYPHNGLSGLSWHPNGDLIFGLGENFAKPWRLSGTDAIVILGAAQGGIFRCTAEGKQLRWIARGLWNPFGTCVREDGEIFAAENDPGERPPCRLLHVIEGGEYGYRRQYGPEAHHPFVCWNGELPGTLPMIHPTGEAPCGVVPLGRGLLVPSWGDHRIDFFQLHPKGASYSATPTTIVQGGRYFRPTCIAQAPSMQGHKRVWYLADWVDGRYNSHGFGRLWKLEIDLNQANWLGPLNIEPPTEITQLARDLREGKRTFSRDQLFDFADSDDPFLSRSALIALSRTCNEWKLDDVARWEPGDRIHCVLACELGIADPNKWLPLFLADNNSAVQYQALRWIAHSEHKQFLSETEKILKRSDINFTLFEAALAARNTLVGKPEAGVRDIELLLARVQDTQLSPQLRAYALRLIPAQARAASDADTLPAKQFPKGLSMQLLEELLSVDDEELSLEVARVAAGNPKVTKQLLLDIATNDKNTATLRSEAIAGLAADAEAHLEVLLELSSNEQHHVREEALRALRSIPFSQAHQDKLGNLAQRFPGSRDLITVLVKPDSLKAERPAATDIQAWIRLVNEVQGAPDIDNGRRIFHHSRVGTCSHCHRHNGRGNIVGPDLTSLYKRANLESLLTSILEPSREMAPEFQPRTLLLKDGRVFTGIRLRSYSREQIRDAYGQTRTFDKGDVESIKDSDVSFMPADLVNTLTNRELRDLIAFLMNDNSSEKN